MLIEVFPDQSEEFNVPQILENSRGNEKTQELNTDYAGVGTEVANEDGLSVKHTGGAYNSKGEYLRELYLRNRETDGRKGSSRPDITFTSEKTDRRLFINTTDSRADGITLTTRERNGAIRIIVNGASGDILVTTPKPGEGQAIDLKALKEFLRPLLHEIDKPKPDIDPRDENVPEELIRQWYSPKN